VFYVAAEDGLRTVIHYPKGWYGPFKPVLLDPDKRYPGLEKPKRRKLSEMSPGEKTQYIQALRNRLDAAEAGSESLATEEPQSATYVSQQTPEDRQKIREGLAKGEFPPDDLGTDKGGVPILPPQKIKDVWGKGEPPEEPKGLPTTDEAHEAELARLRAESDREFEPAPGLSGPSELNPAPVEDWHGKAQ
jgi:hypothetical protein